MQYPEKVQEFLEEVNGQIGYGPMRAAIDEELAAHIEDKTELYREYGLEEEEAVSRAVRDMGDATQIGIQMNEAHHTRLCWPLLGIALMLLIIGILGNLRCSFKGSWKMDFLISKNLYVFPGILALFVSIWFGYPFIIRHVKKLCFGYVGLCVGALVLRLCGSVFYVNVLVENPRGGIALLRYFYSLTVCYGLMLLAVPVLAVVAYGQRHKGVRGIVYTGLFVAVILSLEGVQVRGRYPYMAVLAVLITFLAVMLYMAFHGYLNLPVKKSIPVSVAIFLVLLLGWGAFQGYGNLAREAGQFFAPERYAYSTWSDAYDSLLIRELLGSARIVGEVKLSQEELFDYGTGEWYYGEEGEGIWQREGMTLEDNKAYWQQFFTVDTVTLEDVLPQFYPINYRIADWILSYGWFPGIFLLGLVLVFGVLLAGISFKIRNRLGKLVAFAGSICLLLQILFYVLGNFGFRFGWFGSLPLVSEGMVSGVVNAILLGLVLSVYRYDLVTKEGL